MFNKTVFLLLCLPALCALCVGQKMSHEEILVRQAYARLAYMTQVGVVGKAAVDSYTGKPVDQVRVNKDLAEVSPEFTLDSFEVGDFSQIANRKMSSLLFVPLPPSQILKVDTESRYFKETDQPEITWYGAKARWEIAEPIAAEPLRTVSNFTLQQTLLLNKEAPFLRYATFQVTVSFQGHSEGPFSAFFLFGKDAQGHETVNPQDNVTDTTALAIALKEPMDPSVFLRTRLRETSVLANWLASHEILDESCVVGKVCCSDSHCGIGHAEFQKWLSTPVKGERWRGAKGATDAN